MDKAKLRLAAGVGAALLGVVGIGVLSAAAVVALQGVLGTLVALCIVGGLLFTTAALLLFFMARPDQPTEDDVAKLETLTADALADLPFDTVKSLIEKRPIASLALAATTGYSLSKDPESAARNIRRALTGFL